jgi:hypothetical protein
LARARHGYGTSNDRTYVSRICINFLKAHAKLRNGDLAGKVATLHDGTGYLPSLLVTPLAAGTVKLTPAGEELLAASGMAAE